MPRAASKNRRADIFHEAPDLNRVRAVRRNLLRWYRVHHRKMPWRAEPGQRPNPYHTLVSEAMLQQTQVATVIPYFQRFIAAFPTLADLAAADEQAVLALWQGLGYYRRARNLHAAATHCVTHHAGRIPSDMSALLQLPGVGRYTAGAIASIAFSRSEPILDGNVARVLARWFVIDEPIDQPATRDRLWAMAAAMVPRRGNASGDFNQAMMELGATVCTPRDPKCAACPVRNQCGARSAGRASQLPIVGKRQAPRAVTHRVIAIHRGGRYLFEQRPGEGLWSSMWQLPTDQAPAGEPTRALPGWVAQRFGLHIATPTRLGAFTHQTTHRTITFEVCRAQAAGGRLRAKAGIWRRLDGLDDLPLSNPQRRVVGMLR